MIGHLELEHIKMQRINYDAQCIYGNLNMESVYMEERVFLLLDI